MNGGSVFLDHDKSSLSTTFLDHRLKHVFGGPAGDTWLRADARLEFDMHQLSILDLSPIRAGGSAAESFRNTLDLARHAEEWGFHRFWLAEHHSIPGVASAATSVVIGHVANGTRRIRVGAGGI